MSGFGSGRVLHVSDSDKPSHSSTLSLTPDQLQLILNNQQQFLAIFQQTMGQVLMEQAKTNGLLLGLIEAMGEGDGNDEGPPTSLYLDGRPMR